MPPRRMPRPQNARNNRPRTRQGGNPVRHPPRRQAGSPNPQAMGIDPRGYGLGSNFFSQSNQAAQDYGLPLSGAYEAGARALNDELTQALAAYAGLRPQIQSQGRLGMERIQTDLGRDLDDLRDRLIGRGIYNSGIRTQDEAELGNLYERQQQDLAFGVQAQLGDLANQEAQSRLGYQSGLTDLMLQVAQQEAALGPYSAAPAYGGASYQPAPQVYPYRTQQSGGGGGPRRDWRMGTTWQERQAAGPNWRQKLGRR